MENEINNFFESVTKTVSAHNGGAFIKMLISSPVAWAREHKNVRPEMFDNNVQYLMFLRAMNAIMCARLRPKNNKIQDVARRAMFDFEYAHVPSLYFGIQKQR